MPLAMKAQSLLSQSALQGEWKGYCNLESTDRATTICSLCFFEQLKDKSGVRLISPDLVIRDGMLGIDRSGTISKVPYRYDEDTHMLSFELNGDAQRYKVLLVDADRLVLRDGEGRLLLLERS